MNPADHEGRHPRRFDGLPSTSTQSVEVAFWGAVCYVLLIAGCEGARDPKSVEAVGPTQRPAQVDTPTNAVTEDAPPFKLYSTLPGKMARMEELLNAIDRFLESSDFKDRLLADAEQFYQLLLESRGLYPDELPSEDRPGFDHTIDQTAVTARRLLESVRTTDLAAARKALDDLGKLRVMAHAKYSN